MKFILQSFLITSARQFNNLALIHKSSFSVLIFHMYCESNINNSFILTTWFLPMDMNCRTINLIFFLHFVLSKSQPVVMAFFPNAENCQIGNWQIPTDIFAIIRAQSTNLPIFVTWKNVYCSYLAVEYIIWYIIPMDFISALPL